MDSTQHLDCGVDTTPSGVVQPGEPEPLTGVEVTRLWAVELGLRAGSTWSVRPGALVPVLEQWTAAKGWTPPALRAIGRGLVAAQLRMSYRSSDRRLRLHRDDAARLRKLVWAAWAPRTPPGETPRNRPGKLPLECALAKLAYLKPPPPDFHAQLAIERKSRPNSYPVVDATGRCYPSAPFAARALATKAERNRGTAGQLLLNALAYGRQWHGRLWRKLLPHELALVPPGAPCGVQLEVLNWKSLCVERAQHAQELTERARERYGFGAVSRDDEREG